MTYSDAEKISRMSLFPIVSELYCLDDYSFTLIAAHEGGRNLLYTCEKEGARIQILRISFLPDRNREDYLSEIEFVRYLVDNGGNVANVIESSNGNLLEEVFCDNHTFFICLFEKANGKMLVENGYRYRKGVPLTEYFYNCGKVLGKLHQLSKKYVPVNRRYSFFDKYNVEYIDALIPNSLALLKDKLFLLINTLEKTSQSHELFGMIHFDYNDGNYNIDFNTGQITVYDFDNSCFGWYMYDLAGVWTHGVGWVQFEPSADKRKEYMCEYFSTVITGYRTETEISDSSLDELHLFIQVNLMEEIVDTFEVARNNGKTIECDEELAYRVKCLEDDIPFIGFFNEIYSCEAPFQYEAREI